MARRTIRDWLRSVERAEPEEQWTLLCFLAGADVRLDEAEVKASVPVQEYNRAWPLWRAKALARLKSERS